MQFRCCPNCGAELNLKLEKCEYCRSAINKAIDYNTNTIRYEWGWVDPLEIYGVVSCNMNSAHRKAIMV